MSYVRTSKGEIYKVNQQINDYRNKNLVQVEMNNYSIMLDENDIIKVADTIEELIQIGDIVFYWQQSDDKEHCSLMVYDSDIRTMKYNAITKLLIPVGEHYKCVAKGNPSFNLIEERRYLVNKGELELLWKN